MHIETNEVKETGIAKAITWVKEHFLSKTETDPFISAGHRIIPKGHLVFEYDLRKSSLRLPVVQMENGKKTIEMNKASMYVSALNRDSAKEKLRKKGITKVMPSEKQPREMYNQPAGEKVYFKIRKEAVAAPSRWKRILFILKNTKWRKRENTRKS